jgi:2-iminobutanoate/2-iminopropanoate deaminase
MKSIRNPRVLTSPRPYSPGILVDGWLHISGNVPVNENGEPVGSGAGEQTARVLSNIEGTLEAAGATRTSVVSTTVYLRHISDIDSIDVEYRKFFGEGPFPARTTVEISALGRPEFLVEISAVARLSDDV